MDRGGCRGDDGERLNKKTKCKVAARLKAGQVNTWAEGKGLEVSWCEA